MADDPEYCVYCRVKPCLLRPDETGGGARVQRHLKPLLVHTEFHRLVTGLQDAMQHVFNTKAEDAKEYGDAYAALSMRRKELYEWVAGQTEPPSVLYAVALKF